MRYTDLFSILLKIYSPKLRHDSNLLLVTAECARYLSRVEERSLMNKGNERMNLPTASNDLLRFDCEFTSKIISNNIF